jgi:hypothetical protein
MTLIPHWVAALIGREQAIDANNPDAVARERSLAPRIYTESNEDDGEDAHERIRRANRPHADVPLDHD